MPSYNPWQNAIIQNTLSKKGIIKKQNIVSSGIGGHFERAKVKCPFALSKMPFFIPWQNAFLKKGILNKGILSRDIEGHFWKGKRAFPPNRQIFVSGQFFCPDKRAFTTKSNFAQNLHFLEVFLKLVVHYILNVCMHFFKFISSVSKKILHILSKTRNLTQKVDS